MFGKWVLVVFFFILFQPAIYLQAQEPAFKVKNMEICTAIKSRQPVNAGEVFFNSINRLYCFIHIESNRAPVEISHIWYYNDKEMAKVDLKSNATTWRTWSSKKIIEEWAGDWRVDVVTWDGTILKSKTFVIEPSTEEPDLSLIHI